MSEKASRHYVAVTFILAFAIRIAYAIVAPPFQAPDEYSHFSYAKYVHDAHRLPVQQNPALKPEELEFHQPPLYYVLAASLIPSTSLITAKPLLPLRFVNILFSMLTVGIAYYFASSVLRWNQFSVALVCAIFSLLPTYSYLSATVRNGTLAVFFASLGFYLCTKAVLDGQQRGMRWAMIGAVAGLAILSKLSAIGFVFATAITIVATSPDWRASLRRAGWFGVGVMSTAGWWFARNAIVYGRAFAVVENGYDFVRAPLSWDHEKRSAITIFKTFWAVFGRINEHYFPDIYRFYWWFTGLAVLGIVVRYVLHRRRDWSDLPQQVVNFFILAIGASLLATMYYAHNYNSDQGRYMFPVLIPITTFIVIGLNTFIPERYQRFALDVVLFGFAGINTLVLARLAAVYWQIG
jgi:Dolichyl-phosphate-mannose-protein mannosyltransferase